MAVLKLKLATDPRWVNIAEKNLQEVLTDHAFCEQKAASSAISFIVQFPEQAKLVRAMSELAIEEMQHFQMVLDHLGRRGWTLGKERKDPYVYDLQQFFKGGTGRQQLLINKLLLAGMIEARSCERFRVLSENLQDEELRTFYRDLMKSEASHYTLFLQFARELGQGICDVDQLWDDFLSFESDVMHKYGKNETIHG